MTHYYTLTGARCLSTGSVQFLYVNIMYVQKTIEKGAHYQQLTDTKLHEYSSTSFRNKHG